MSEIPELKIETSENYSEWGSIVGGSWWDISRNFDAEGSRETFPISNLRSDDWSPSLLGQGEVGRMSSKVVQRHVKRELPAYVWMTGMGTLATILALVWR